MSAFKVGDRVEIVGPAENGSTAFVGQTSPVSRVWNNGLGADVHGWGYPASSLRLVPAFKVRDWVRVNVASDGSTLFAGQEGRVILELEICPVQYRVELERGGSMTFYARDLRLVPAFKAGDRVRLPGKLVSYPGETETTIACVWHAEGKPDLYELEDGSYRRLEELQHAPEPAREPKPGEVWAWGPWVMQVLSEGRVSHLENGMICYAESSHEELGKYGKFLAPDLASYFKARPC